MIDIWMLFTMTVPFLEVVFHTINEVFPRPDFGPERQIRLVRVQPVDKLEEEEGLPGPWLLTVACARLGSAHDFTPSSMTHARGYATLNEPSREPPA